MENKNKPAYPLSGKKYQDDIGKGVSADEYKGLTKREIFCLHNGVPKTGDPELDAIIIEGNKIKTAMAAMQGILSKEAWTDRILNEGGADTLPNRIANASIKCADELLKQLKESE